MSTVGNSLRAASEKGLDMHLYRNTWICICIESGKNVGALIYAWLHLVLPLRLLQLLIYRVYRSRIVTAVCAMCNVQFVQCAFTGAAL